jgi:death-on-curing protein
VDPDFLSLEEVLVLHEDRIRRYGGTAGIRDLELLSSALGTVSASFGGEFLHGSLFEMAAAYLFHITRNHPFLDGNKRTGLAAALVFLSIHDVEIEASEDDLTELVLGVAEGRVSKAEVAVFLQSHASE